jgi:hypothetical protein
MDHGLIAASSLTAGNRTMLTLRGGHCAGSPIINRDATNTSRLFKAGGMEVEC